MFTENTNAYKKNESIVKNEIKYYEKFVSETHIVEYLDNNRLSEDVIAFQNINRAIYLSYTLFGNNKILDYYIDNNHEASIYGIASLENDNISYFYTQYLPKYDVEGKILNLNGLNPIDYVFSKYIESIGENAYFMFTFDKEISNIPVLNSQISYYIYHYLYIDGNDNAGKQGEHYYNVFTGAYASMLKEAEELLINSEPYYSTHYLIYKDAYNLQARQTNLSLIVSLFISYLIIILLPKLLFKNERTISYKIFGLGVINMNNESNKWYLVIFKSILGFLGSFIILYIAYLFSPFNGGYNAMITPFISNSNISLGLIILIIFIIGTIINLIGLFTHYHQNALNLLFNDKVVDTHYLDEGDNDDKFEGKSY